MINFRPNLVIDTSVAFEEDSWDEIQVGGVRFKNVKLCGRCILTTVDPITAKRSSDKEPLTTLSRYRKMDNGEVMFGCNLIALNEGIINKDDKLEVISFK